jgi:hypothetical protein
MQLDIFRCCFTLLIAIAIAGCGPSGPAKYPVGGVITFKGEPLPTGKMTLIPADSKARTTVAEITAGKYATEVTQGDWTINIQAVRETGPVIEALREAPREQYLPAKYNSESTLKITVPSTDGKFDFALEP